MGKRAVVLLSGGLDSATVLAIAKENGFETYALSFDYGQRHRWELQAAQQVADSLGVAGRQVIKFDLRAFGGSALTSDIKVPKGRQIDDSIPVTYVPARNTIFLSFSLAWAEVLGADDIFLGVNALDYSGYPDCRPEYIDAFQRVADLATTRKMSIHAPLIHMTKADIIRKGLALGIDFSLTSSCYDPSIDGAPCGSCDSCQLRAKGFEEAGVADPALRRDQK